MDNYKETFTTWNKVAELYQDKFMHLDLYNDSYDVICNTIKKEKAKLLEIGCGPANITKYLLSKRPDFDILGIDIAPNMISLAQKNNLTARFKVMDSRDIDKLNSTFDAIVIGFCLPYLSPTDGKKLIKDTYKLLNPNGLLYLSFVEGDPTQSGFKTGSSGDRTYFYYHRLAEISQQLKQYGFTDLAISKVDYSLGSKGTEQHTILTALK